MRPRDESHRRITPIASETHRWSSRKTVEGAAMPNLVADKQRSSRVIAAMPRWRSRISWNGAGWITPVARRPCQSQVDTKSRPGCQQPRRYMPVERDNTGSAGRHCRGRQPVRPSTRRRRIAHCCHLPIDRPSRASGAAPTVSFGCSQALPSAGATAIGTNRHSCATATTSVPRRPGRACRRQPCN